MNSNAHEPTLGKILARYVESMGNSGAAAERLIGPLWRKAYDQAGRPRGIIPPKEGYRLAKLYQRELRAEMRRVCGRFDAAQLFFAVRFWTPRSIGEFGLSFREEDNPEEAHIATMALRRIATSAALLYGRPSPEGYVTLSGGEVSPGQEKRFARAFVSLMMLSYTYMFFSWSVRAFTSMGYRIFVDESRMRLLDEDAEEQDLLTFSNDNRKHASYDLLIRLGEFEGRTESIGQPHVEPGRTALGNRSAMFTAWYAVEPGGPAGYGVRAEVLDPVEGLLLEHEELDPGLATAAWGMTFREFIAMLGGFSRMLEDRMSADWIFEMAGVEGVNMAWHIFWGCTVPFFAPELEDEGEDTLVDYARGYAIKKGFDLDGLDLLDARDRFLDLAVSTGKHEVDDDSGDPSGISLADGRYSYLMHNFGAMYVADLFHADHWLNRPLDMLNGQMGGAAGDLKGSRVENRVWDYMASSTKIEAVHELRNATVREIGKKGPFNDLDCPLRIGDVLVLAEVKGKYMARAPEAFVSPTLMRRRWDDNEKFLKKIDRTAQLVSERKTDATFRYPLAGVRHILPVVVRPYPEWIPDLTDKHWLRKPARPDVGVPRVLTPRELREYLENTTANEIANLPGSYVVSL